MSSLVNKKIINNLFDGRFIVGTTLFIIGISVGYLLWGKASDLDISQNRANDPNLIFTNPLLSCGISENKEFTEYKPLESTINSLITKLDPHNENTISVYYRDLDSGRWFGINETDVYSPASLLKVPIMIAYLKEAETNPSILEKRVYYDGNTPSLNSVEYYKSNSEVKAGNYYTVNQLITSMIEHSDNVATDLLFKGIDSSSLDEVMTDIGIHLPPANAANGTNDYLTIKSYSYLFRLLYNSTYLNRDMSEKALKLLSYTDFTQGIVGGIPKGIKSAQKFGERTFLDNAFNASSRELHDCGIVYYPKHPYLLCIMTKGKDFDSLSLIIRNISTIIYNKVSDEYK